MMSMSDTEKGTGDDVVDVQDVSPLRPVAAVMAALVQSEEGKYGLIVHEGAEPNLEHKDRETGRTMPETREPVVLWLGFASPWGLPLTRVG